MSSDVQSLPAVDQRNIASGVIEILRGRKIFRFDTFGDEAFWGDTLGLHARSPAQANGGVGAGLEPEGGARARAQGRRRRAAARRCAAICVAGASTSTIPATTLALLKLDAVVGVRGFFDERSRRLQSVGIQCALCHSTVDDSFAPGIGTPARRLGRTAI